MASEASPSPGWWKLTFLRKKKSEPKVLYEIPAEYGSNTTGVVAAATVAEGGGGITAAAQEDSRFNARLERIVDKSATRGRHVKVSHSGRFKEKKRVRATLAENPDLFPGDGTAPSDENQRAGK